MANLGGAAEARRDAHGLETLWGKIHPRNFGPPERPRRAAKRSRRRQVVSVLSRNDDGVLYEPQTKETRAAYEALLGVIRQHLGDQPPDVLAGAADEVLTILKSPDETMDSPDKKDEIETLLDTFDQLVSIGKLITDFHGAAPGVSGDDDDIGVAVEFQESDDDDDTHNSNQALAIDAYWLERKVSLAYEEVDPLHMRELAEEILKVLAEGHDERDAENRLVMLLDYDKFDLVRFLLRNRLKIVWCTRLARADDQVQRKKIEEEMASNQKLAPVLEQLFETRASAKE